MAVRIRLFRVGKRHFPSYRIVAADSRASRDGKFLEILGFYDPKEDPPMVSIDTEKLKHWLDKGAQMTSAVKSILKKAS